MKTDQQQPVQSDYVFTEKPCYDNRPHPDVPVLPMSALSCSTIASADINRWIMSAQVTMNGRGLLLN